MPIASLLCGGGRHWGAPLGDTQGSCRTQSSKCFYPSCRSVVSQVQSCKLGRITQSQRHCQGSSWGAGEAGERVKGAMLPSMKPCEAGHPHPVQAKDAACLVLPEDRSTVTLPPSPYGAVTEGTLPRHSESSRPLSGKHCLRAQHWVLNVKPQFICDLHESPPRHALIPISQTRERRL